MSEMQAADLLSAARKLCVDPAGGGGIRWQRAAALLTRASLELALDDFWRARAPGVAECQAARSKMLCLPVYLGDKERARALYQLWAVLSSACHRHAYELDPTVDELIRWIDDVELFHEDMELERLDKRSS